jgi:hypothetical protein
MVSRPEQIPNATRPTDTANACETLKRAIITRDADLAASVYAQDAELVVINRNYPPSRPLILRGYPAALDLWRDICGKEMTHSITATVIGQDGFAIRESCAYADGGRVVGHVIAELRNGLIVRHLSVDCWDE